MTQRQLLQLEQAVAKARGRYEALSDQFYQLRDEVHQASRDWHAAVEARNKARAVAKVTGRTRSRSRKTT